MFETTMIYPYDKLIWCQKTERPIIYGCDVRTILLCKAFRNHWPCSFAYSLRLLGADGLLYDENMENPQPWSSVDFDYWTFLFRNLN